MTDLVKQPLSMQQRIQLQMAKRNSGGAPALQTTPQQQAAPRTLLLDVSGSMDLDSEQPGVSRIEALRKLVADMRLTPEHPMYAFSYSARRCHAKAIPEPSGGTDLAGAFRSLKQEGHKSVVLITDGQPDDAEEALLEAKGLHLEIFYVGPDRKPKFLSQLAKACGGSANQATMNKELAATVRKLLMA